MKIVAQERSGKNEINLKFFKTKQKKKGFGFRKRKSDSDTDTEI